VGLGYVTAEPGAQADSVLGDTYEVEVACERFSAAVSLRPLYDPDNAKIRR